MGGEVGGDGEAEGKGIRGGWMDRYQLVTH